MSEAPVAKIWWEAPHEGSLEVFLAPEAVVSFGRGGECAIRVGHAPVYAPQVPRVWGEISWHRGSVYVFNSSSMWGLSLAPSIEAAGRPTVDVPPGAGASSPDSMFRILGKAPNFQMSLFVRSVRGPRGVGLEAADDPPSFVPFTLTPTQKIIGSAVIAPVLAGAPTRASYAEVAASTHYALRTVREAVAALDGLFVLYRLVDVHHTPGDALDRVAHVLRLHPALLGPRD